MPDEALVGLPILDWRGLVGAYYLSVSCCPMQLRISRVRTKRCRMRRGVAVEVVYADDPIVCAGREIAAVGRESDGVNGAEVVAHMTELSGFGVGRVVRVVYGISRPHANMTICQRTSEMIQLGQGMRQRQGDGIPPPAVASLEPSGETWQL